MGALPPCRSPRRSMTLSRTAAVGGGVDIYLERHVSLRPHARLVLVTADSQVRPLAVYGVHVTYHFAEDPFDPDRR